MLVKFLIFPLFYTPCSGSTDPNECGSEWIRIHIPELYATSPFLVNNAICNLSGFKERVSEGAEEKREVAGEAEGLFY